MNIDLAQNVAITILALLLLLEIRSNRSLVDSIEGLCDWLNEHITKV